MNDLIIEKTQSTPYVFFAQDSNCLVIQGESFPENSAKFYAPVLAWLNEYVAELDNRRITVDFKIVYFNSSTAKVLLTIFDILEDAVRHGKNIVVNWTCDPKNETAMECGEEFKEDLTVLPFNITVL
jgi:hypothetical protein